MKQAGIMVHDSDEPDHYVLNQSNIYFAFVTHTHTSTYAHTHIYFAFVAHPHTPFAFVNPRTQTDPDRTWSLPVHSLALLLST